MTQPLMQMDQCRQLIERNVLILERARSLGGDLNDAQVFWQPPEGGWSVGQVYEHLCVSCSKYLQGMRKYGSAPQEALAGRDVVWRPSFSGWALMKSLELFRNLPAPGAFRPPLKPRPHVLEIFLDHHREIGNLMNATVALDWNRIMIPSPVVPYVQMNIGDCFSVLVIHAERHLGQIEKLRSRPEFPK